jgi:prepilin-type processing-associated H-X9-DG protein
METGGLEADRWMWVNQVIPFGYFPRNDGVHSNGVNILFLDGHTGYRKYTDVFTSDSSGEGKIFWQGIE